MAPKKREDDPLEEDRHSEEREECVQNIIQAVLDGAFAGVERAEIEQKANRAFADAIKQGTTLARRLTVPPIDATALRDGEPWEADRPPAPLKQDPWNRGRAAVTTKAPPSEEQKVEESQQKQGGKSGARTKQDGTGKVSTDDRPLSQGGERRTAEEGKGRASTTEGQQRSQHRRQGEERLREEVAARREAVEARQRREDEEKEEKRRLESFKKDLRGKDYSYDHRGNAVVLAKVDPSKLPSSSINVSTAVPNPSPSNSKATTKPTNKERRPVFPTQRLEHPTDSFYKPKALATQPKPSESIEPAPGVSLEEDGVVRRGPPLQQQQPRSPQRAKAEPSPSTETEKPKKGLSAKSAEPAGKAESSERTKASAATVYYRRPRRRISRSASLPQASGHRGRGGEHAWVRDDSHGHGESPKASFFSEIGRNATRRLPTAFM